MLDISRNVLKMSNALSGCVLNVCLKCKKDYADLSLILLIKRIKEV